MHLLREKGEKQFRQQLSGDRTQRSSKTPYADDRRNEVGVYLTIALDPVSATVLALRVFCGPLRYFASNLLA